MARHYLLEVDGYPLLGVADMERCLRSARTVAVLGIKPDSRRQLDAHQIPFYLQRVGYRVIPVPTRYPEATHILGVPVMRRLSQLPAPVDILNVFCKQEDFDPWLDDVVKLKPRVVWFQSGLRSPEAAKALDEASIVVAEDCIGCRRASIAPSYEPLEGQLER